MSELTNVVECEGMIYVPESRTYKLDVDYASTRLNEKLNLKYGNGDTGKANAEEILDRVMRQYYIYSYGNEKMYPEDKLKKEYYMVTDEDVVCISREIMLHHLESTVLTRRDLLIMEHGVDLDEAKLIEDFDQNMEKYRFSVDTRDLFNQHKRLRYKERLNLHYIDPTLIRNGY
jgi:hypothetical protein